LTGLPGDTPITKKTYLDDLYKPRTIRHSNAVLRSCYDFWIETGGGRWSTRCR
jgi:hypothetical protein